MKCVQHVGGCLACVHWCMHACVCMCVNVFVNFCVWSKAVQYMFNDMSDDQKFAVVVGDVWENAISMSRF